MWFHNEKCVHQLHDFKLQKQMPWDMNFNRHILSIYQKRSIKFWCPSMDPRVVLPFRNPHSFGMAACRTWWLWIYIRCCTYPVSPQGVTTSPQPVQWQPGIPPPFCGVRLEKSVCEKPSTDLETPLDAKSLRVEAELFGERICKSIVLMGAGSVSIANYALEHREGMSGWLQLFVCRTPICSTRYDESRCLEVRQGISVLSFAVEEQRFLHCRQKYNYWCSYVHRLQTGWLYLIQWCCVICVYVECLQFTESCWDSCYREGLVPPINRHQPLIRLY